MKRKLKLFLKGTKIVGVIASLADLNAALASPDIADGFEWRLDRFSGRTAAEGIERLKWLGKVIILTVRDHAEGGGKQDWDLKRRASGMSIYMRLADIVDIEALNAVRFRELGIMRLAEELGVGMIISAHFLDRVPYKFELICAWDVFEAIGGDIFKVAIQIENPLEMARFSKWVSPLMRDPANKWRIAPMATGREYGPSSRLKFAKNGSALVYGFLGKAVIEGQLSVLELRHRLNK
jgi:3-dehydroquinate dehydratase type I